MAIPKWYGVQLFVHLTDGEAEAEGGESVLPMLLHSVP